MTTLLEILGILWFGYRIYRNRYGFWRWLLACAYWTAVLALAVFALASFWLAISGHNPVWMLDVLAAFWIFSILPNPKNGILKRNPKIFRAFFRDFSQN